MLANHVLRAKDKEGQFFPEITVLLTFQGTAESRFSDCRFSEEPRFSEVFSADRIFMKQKL